jgi:hypothetical protein
VFSDAAGLTLNIDLDVGGRRGLQLGLIPGHWSLLAIYKEQTGAQLGSAIAIPLGGRIDFALVGLLSGPPPQLEHEQSWYAEGLLFPGGLISHLAGSLAWEHGPLRFSLVAAAAAGRWIGPGTFATLDMNLSAVLMDLDLMLGYCSPQYFTPEGDTGDLEWIVSARANRDFGAIRLTAACSKELSPLPPLPEAFRGTRDQLTAGIEILRKTATRRAWSLEGEAELQREWSEEGEENSRRCLGAAAALDWNVSGFSVGISEVRHGESELVRDVGVKVSHDPPWGKIELEAGYRQSPIPGLDLAAALDVTGEEKRFYILVGTEEVLPLRASADSLRAGDWLELFALRVGWETKSQWQFRR